MPQAHHSQQTTTRGQRSIWDCFPHLVCHIPVTKLDRFNQFGFWSNLCSARITSSWRWRRWEEKRMGLLTFESSVIDIAKLTANKLYKVKTYFKTFFQKYECVHTEYYWSTYALGIVVFLEIFIHFSVHSIQHELCWNFSAGGEPGPERFAVPDSSRPRPATCQAGIPYRQGRPKAIHI